MTTIKLHSLALFIGCLCASTAWSASFPSHHSNRGDGCPTAVENVVKVEQTVAHPELMNQDKNSASASASASTRATDNKTTAPAANVQLDQKAAGSGGGAGKTAAASASQKALPAVQ
jgi:hypothetical protein